MPMNGMDKMTNMSGSPLHDMMMMYFYAEMPMGPLLFKGMKPRTAGELVAYCVVIIFVGIFYEWLKYYRTHHYTQYNSCVRYTLEATQSMNMVSSTPEAAGSQLRNSCNGMMTPMQVAMTNRRSRWSWSHGVQSLLQCVQVTISYGLMLVAMTYNLWYFLSVVLGAGIGYFCFGTRGGQKENTSVAQLTEHCS